MKARLRPLWLFVGLALTFANQTVASSAPETRKPHVPAAVDKPLQKLAQEQPQLRVRVIIQSRYAADAEEAVRSSGGTVFTRLPNVAGVAAVVPAGRIADLASLRGIKRIALDPPVRPAQTHTTSTLPVSVYPETVGAPGAWSMGLTGRGVAIAVLDSGVHGHPDFGDPSRVIHSERFNAEGSATSDYFGHGTWVAGIAVGNGAAADGHYKGVAPQANIVNLKVTNETGAAYTSDVVRALGWVVANASRYNIRVVDLSFVSGVKESYLTSVLDAAVEMVWHAGVVVVASAGNKGAGGVGYAPANDPYVITVGATDDHATASRADDTLAWFSSFGMTQDNIFKPDLVAPGRHIIAPLASGDSVLAREFPTKLVGERYIQLSGTSAAAPVVAGAATLLLQDRPSLKPDELKWLVTHSAYRLPGVIGTGSGLLDIPAAVSLRGRIDRANRGLIPSHMLALAYFSLRNRLDRNADSSGHGPGDHTWTRGKTEDDDSSNADSINWATVSWDSVSWDSVSWDSVSWDSVSWDSVSWDSVSWDSVSWDSVSWDSVSWDSVSWDSVIGAD